MENEAILFAEVYHGNESDACTLLDSVRTAQSNIQQANSNVEIKEAVTDKGCHKSEILAKFRADELRTKHSGSSLNGQDC